MFVCCLILASRGPSVLTTVQSHPAALWAEWKLSESARHPSARPHCHNYDCDCCDFDSWCDRLKGSGLFEVLFEAVCAVNPAHTTKWLHMYPIARRHSVACSFWVECLASCSCRAFHHAVIVRIVWEGGGGRESREMHFLSPTVWSAWQGRSDVCVFVWSAWLHFGPVHMNSEFSF